MIMINDNIDCINVMIYRYIDNHYINYSLFHIHIIMNSVSFVDGKLYDSSKENLSKFCDEVERITGTGCRYYFARYYSTDDV